MVSTIYYVTKVKYVYSEEVTIFNDLRVIVGYTLPTPKHIHTHIYIEDWRGFLNSPKKRDGQLFLPKKKGLLYGCACC